MKKIFTLFVSILIGNLANSQVNNNPVTDVLYRYDLNTGTSRNILKADFVNSIKGCFLMQNGGCLVTSNGGLSFAESNPTNDTLTEYIDVVALPGKWLAISKNGKAFYSVNAGISWTTIMDSSSHAQFMSADILGNTIAISGKQGLLYVLSNDGSDNFTAQDYSVDTMSNVDITQVKFMNGQLMVTTNNGGVYNYNVTSNTMATSYLVGGESIVNLKIDALGYGFFLTQLGKIFKTTDGGNSWNLKADNFGVQWNGIDFGDSLVLAVGDSGNIAVSTNYGELFELYTAGTGNSLNAARVKSPRGYVTGSGGLGFVVSVSDSTLNLRKVKDNFNPNLIFPNPASSQITLENPFALAGSNSITVAQVFDNTGKEVNSFVLNSVRNKIIDVSTYSKGNYWVVFSNQGKKVNSRFTKIE
jgi:photosystem II stability/assembly factor-like uncharacterized protein